VSQQDQAATAITPVSAPAAAPAAVSPPKSSSFWTRLVIPLFAVIAALVFIAIATLNWNEWTGSAVVQTTDDAYVRADLTRLSSRVAGEVLTVAVSDFQRVKAGDLLIRIDPADYEAQVAQAEASVAAAQAALDNLANQVELQYATIAQAEAQQASAIAQQVEARQEQERQQSLSQTEAGTRQRLEQATAAYAKADADVRASRAVIAAQKHQLEVLSGTKKQRAADLEGAKATLAAAKLKLGYTKIVAPFDGVTGEREVQPGDYVNIGTNLVNVVPLPNVYVIANYKETQLTRVQPGQPVVITVDSFPHKKLHGRVERISPASGSQFALLPPDNATGNFTKVTQRVPV
jgi:membrane fusion protein (multidrug efflux system)